VERLVSGGIDRSYILRVPRTYDATKPLPLVIVLHGWTSNARSAEIGTHMAEESEKNGFVMVAPDGLGSPQGWNAGFIDLSGKAQDDVQFINALIDKVESEVGVDVDRVYVAGHSNGAFMAHFLAARLSSRLAAVAAVAGTVGVPDRDGGFKTIPEPSDPVSVLLIHGRKDPMVQYDSKSVALLHDVGALDSAKWWAKRDGCSLTPAETTSLNGNVVTDTFSGGKNGAEVTLISIANGVHDWPGGIGRDGPETTTGVNASDLIWDFFKAHPKHR
jgi:polyhydroxybutyrate depolymerase